MANSTTSHGTTPRTTSSSSTTCYTSSTFTCPKERHQRPINRWSNQRSLPMACSTTNTCPSPRSTSRYGSIFQCEAWWSENSCLEGWHQRSFNRWSNCRCLLMAYTSTISSSSSRPTSRNGSIFCKWIRGKWLKVIRRTFRCNPYQTRYLWFIRGRI